MTFCLIVKHERTDSPAVFAAILVFQLESIGKSKHAGMKCNRDDLMLDCTIPMTHRCTWLSYETRFTWITLHTSTALTHHVMQSLTLLIVYLFICLFVNRKHSNVIL